MSQEGRASSTETARPETSKGLRYKTLEQAWPLSLRNVLCEASRRTSSWDPSRGGGRSKHRMDLSESEVDCRRVRP